MKRKRASFFDPCIRGWVRFQGKIIRFLSYTNYGPWDYGLEPRHFLFRLPSNDSRPRGVHCSGSEWCADWYARLPIGQWVEIVAPAEPRALIGWPTAGEAS